jgi:formylglycine-generating enzyme required for sulfatase activity
MRIQGSSLLFFALLFAALASGCVDTRPPPFIPKHAQAAYGPKVFVADLTIDTPPLNNMCSRFGQVTKTPTVATATATVMPLDNLTDASGMLVPIPANQPHNCYVKVQPKTLRVDAVEVTNDLFQLCVDSGVCDAPDPSKASKADACSNEDRFEACPVGEVSQQQAMIFCQFIGRRLPSGLEHVIIRQASLSTSDSQDPHKIPVFPNGKDESKPPATCNDAVVGSAGCTRAQPITLTGEEDAMNPDGTIEKEAGVSAGGAVNDAISAASSTKIFDLMGNAAEWSSDLMPAVPRVNDLPWFCSDTLLARQSPSMPPQCPTGSKCVYGNYQPPGLLYGEYPVCIAWPGFHPQGSVGTLFGGSFGDMKADRQHIGTFARRIEKNPNGSSLNREYGFRCVGDPNSQDAVVAQ